MNISELLHSPPGDGGAAVGRPVVVAGTFAYFSIPVAALPSYNTPMV